MRKTALVLGIVMLMVQLFTPMSVSAASAMQAEAKAGDVNIDGLIREGEYGEPFVLSALNSVSWNNWDSIDTAVIYRFAWSQKGLYVAITYSPTYVEEESALQFVCNPGNQIPGSQQGLFFTIYPNHRVLLHNHRTLAGDASGSAYDISHQVEIASEMRNSYRTTEVLLPINAFRITNSNFTFSQGTMRASAVVMLYRDGRYTNGAAVSSNLEGWDLNTIGLGTLTLLPPRQSGSGNIDPDFGVDSDSDSDSDFSENSTAVIQSIGTVALIALGFYLILGVVVTIFAIVLLIVLCVRRKNRKKRT